MSAPLLESARLWLAELLRALPRILPFWLGAWLFCLLLLLFAFRALRPRLRTRAVQFDSALQAFAKRLRYKGESESAAPTLERVLTERVLAERVLLTWFFRFWTNFASAPSLSVISIALAIIMFDQRRNLSFAGSNFLRLNDPATQFQETQTWLLPALCYFGSMGLSYVLKRVFKRVRPVRTKGDFGHRLKDGSFPSGHSLTAFSFWTMCVLVALGHGMSTLLMAMSALAIILLTGLSRIYMAVHWPSDVAGGYVIGAVWTAICFVALWFTV